MISLLNVLRRAFATAMLMPFLALCLISPAAMLGRDTNGALTMVLCTGDGPVEMTINLGTGDPQAKQRCDWALAHSDVLQDAPFAIVASLLVFRRVALARPIALWQPAFDPRNLWPRGPPIPV